MYSDLFYVVPTDARINQLRSNYPYGIGGTTNYYTFTNTSKISNSAIPNYVYTGRVYEPINEFKGDVA
ncbi:endonuclease [Chryseobacterium indoltheticum]|uniref:endonuclease n=1 Tax=Chryseobacterium indoltheticum TaxID=254 RepID=UPI003F49248C